MGHRSSSWPKWLVRWLVLSLGLHLIAAVFSTGYQNSDEHFQILEFLNAYLGGTPTSALPIEYGKMIRPWFQPFLYGVPTELLRLFGTDDPFARALSYRIVSALIGWGSIVSLAFCSLRWCRTEKAQRNCAALLALTWYLPALHARHSSENLSGSLFVIGIGFVVATLERPRLWVTLTAGALWGLAFEARYQVGIMVAGGLVWLLLLARGLRWPARARVVLTLSCGVLIAIAFGTWLDRVGYGQWTFAPWNYFHFNLIEGYVSSTDTSPIWDYFRRAWTETWPLLGFLSFAGVIAFWIGYPLHFLTWTHLPLFLVHTLIGHKETRFLFPLMHSAPLAWAILLETRVPGGRTLWVWLHARTYRRVLVRAVIALNLIALAALSLLPISLPVRFYERVYGIRTLYYVERDPYTILGIPMYFYRAKDAASMKLDAANLPPGEFWLAHPHPALPEPLSLRCERRFSSIPEWVRKLDGPGVLRNVNDWTLYLCHPVAAKEAVGKPDLNREGEKRDHGK